MRFRDYIIQDLRVSHIATISVAQSNLIILKYVIKGVLISWGFRAVFCYRLAHGAHQRNLETLAKALYRLGYSTTKAQISYRARIGPGLELPHPFGIIIGWDTIIGMNCIIGQHVTLGGNLGKQDESGRKYPEIGNNVMILAGSVVAGPVEIGDNVLIGANCVITKSIPTNSLVKQRFQIIQDWK